MNKLTSLCTFIGLPIVCGEWDGPFWVQVVLMVAMLIPLCVSVAKGLKDAPTFEEWEESNHGHRESDGSASRTA